MAACAYLLDTLRRCVQAEGRGSGFYCAGGPKGRGPAFIRTPGWLRMKAEGGAETHGTLWGECQPPSYKAGLQTLAGKGWAERDLYGILRAGSRESP